MKRSYAAAACRLGLSSRGGLMMTLCCVIAGSLMLGVASGAQKGKKGDLVGIWDCTDPATRRHVADYEFKRDGTYTKNGNAGVNRYIPGSFPYRYDGGILTLSYVHGNTGREDKMLRGRIEWVDDDLARLTLIDGYDVRADLKGKTLELNRQ